MMFFGGRNSPSWLRFLRLALLVGILVLGATLGNHSKTYNDIHTVYLVIFVALLALTFVLGRRGGTAGQGMGGRGMGRRGMGGGPFGQGPGQNVPSGGTVGDAVHDNVGGTVGSGSFGTPPPPPTPASVPPVPSAAPEPEIQTQEPGSPS